MRGKTMITKNLTKDLIGGVFLLATGLLYFALAYDSGVTHLTQDIEVEAVDAFLVEDVERANPVTELFVIEAPGHEREPDCI